MARQEGYDSVIGYSTDRGGNEFISEIFDLREKTYPSLESESEINQDYLTNTDIKYSLSTDSQGRKLSKGQQEYFKDSKVRDEQGRLLEVYHGTNADFTVFNKSMVGSNTGSRGFYGAGFYLATNKRDAQSYGDKTFEVYVSAKNLLDIDSKDWTYLLGLEKNLND